VISIILSPFQEVKKTDANHVDTIVSKILFKTLGYVAQVLYMKFAKTSPSPVSPYFSFYPTIFLLSFRHCGVILPVRCSSVVDPDTEL
jgi:hypothetical protein